MAARQPTADVSEQQERATDMLNYIFFLSQLETTGFYINRKEQALIIHKPSSQSYFYKQHVFLHLNLKMKLKATSLLTESMGQIK